MKPHKNSFSVESKEDKTEAKLLLLLLLEEVIRGLGLTKQAKDYDEEDSTLCHHIVASWIAVWF